MGNGYTPVVPEGYELVYEFREMRRRLRELEALDGTQIYNTVQELRKLVNGLIEQTEINVSGNVTAGGNVSAAGTGTFSAGMNSVDVYSRIVTGSGGYTSTYTNSVGQMGTVPSSMRFKRDVADAVIDPAMVEAIRLVTFRYRDAVESLGDRAPVEVGVIAEEVDELGLHWLIDYDEQGEPLAFKYERLAVALLAVVQDQGRRLSAAGL